MYALEKRNDETLPNKPDDREMLGRHLLGSPSRLFAVTATRHGWSKAMNNTIRLLAWTAALIVSGPAAHAEPVTSMDQVGNAILAFWKPPAGIATSSVTLRFSLKRDGSLIGLPRATAINVTGDDNARKEFVAAAIDAVNRCTPIELAPALAQGIGGQTFSMAFATGDGVSGITPGN